MGSALQTDLSNLLLNDFTSVVIITAIGYDYVLTFSSEIEYIWNNRWTPVSTIFVIIRYFGLLGFVLLSILGSSFVPGPVNVSGVLNTISTWAILVYICAADLVMILRLWAMYNRSRIILGILLTSYLGEVIPSTIGSIIYSNPKNIRVTVSSILDLSFCSLELASDNWNKASSISQLVHAGVMCTLVIIQFTMRSVHMYRATKQWRLGPLINLLIVEGMVYFFGILMWNLINTLFDFGKFSGAGLGATALTLLEYIPISTLTPRFILNMRELYGRGVQGGRGHGIDTGFGLTTLSVYGASRSSIMFADDEEREGLEDDREDISMRTRTNQLHPNQTSC